MAHEIYKVRAGGRRGNRKWIVVETRPNTVFEATVMETNDRQRADQLAAELNEEERRQPMSHREADELGCKGF